MDHSLFDGTFYRLFARFPCSKNNKNSLLIERKPLPLQADYYLI